MNRTVRILMLAAFAVSIAVPSHACWDYWYDDWYYYDYYDSYDYYDDYSSYDYYDDDDYDYDYNSYDYNDDYDYDYNYDSYGNNGNTCDFENYDDRYDYENYEDSYDDIYLDCDHNDSNDDEVVYGEIENWGSSMEGTTDELFVTGHDNFWDDPIFQEDNSWMDFGNDDEEIAEPQEKTSEDSDKVDTDTGNGGHKDDSPGCLGDNNSSEDSPAGGPPCKISDWEKISIEKLKLIPGVHYVPNLPNEFQPQKLNCECVANSIAIVSSIIDGTDPADTREIIRKIAKDAGYDLDNIGIPNGKIHSLLNDYCAILDDNRFNRNVIENYMDNEHKPIMVLTDMLDRYDNPMGAHMLVVVAYDRDNYYCAYGGKNSAVVPKTDFEVKNSDGSMKYKIYMYNGKKHVNR